MEKKENRKGYRIISDDSMVSLNFRLELLERRVFLLEKCVSPEVLTFLRDKDVLEVFCRKGVNGMSNVPCVVFMSNRCFLASSEMMLYLDEDKGEEVGVALAVQDNEKPLGYLVFKRLHDEPLPSNPAKRMVLYQLTEVKPADFQSRLPLVFLSDVLWRRQEAVEVQQSICSFRQALG